MNRPSRETAAGRAYLDLQARARRDGRPTDELLVLYVLERFLYRLSRSSLRDRLILKGGMLLAALDQRRPTGDVDLLARDVANDVGTVSDLVREVLRLDFDDGVVFNVEELRAQVIRDTDFVQRCAHCRARHGCACSTPTAPRRERRRPSHTVTRRNRVPGPARRAVHGHRLSHRDGSSPAADSPIGCRPATTKRSRKSSSSPTRS